MITRTNAFVTSDQKTFSDLDAAIGHELSLLFPEMAESFVREILTQRDKVMDLLSTECGSRPRARKINGVSKKHKAAAAMPELPGTQ